MSTIDDAAPVRLGWRSSLGIGEEAQYGVPATIDRFLDFNSEGLQLQQQRLESQAVRNSEFQTHWAEGSRGAEGDLTLELAGVAQGLLWKHAFGDVVTDQPDAVDAPGVWRHKFTPGDLTARYLTAQVVRDDVPFTYTGCKITQLQLSCDVDQIAQLQVSLAGRDEQLDVPAAPPSYPTPYPLLTYVHGSLLIAGAEVAVNSVQATLDNGLDTDRRRLGSGLRRNAQRTAFRDLTGSINADFTDLTLYNRFVSGEEATLELRFVSPELAGPGLPYSVSLLTSVRFDGNTPTVGGPDEIRQELEWKAFPSSEVPDVVEVVIVTDAEEL
jgi:hypothetical protein